MRFVFVHRGIREHEFSTILLLVWIDHLFGTHTANKLAQKLEKAAT